MVINMNEETFYSQSYRDSLHDYLLSCETVNSSHWDWIVLTAANNRQAIAYRLQIEKKEKENRLPKGTRFLVVSDYKDERIGSGGATLNVLRLIAEEIGSEKLLLQKILIIHSGGDSKRIPQYSSCGKLFAPVPRLLPDRKISTLFDELLIAACDIPNRCGNGMLIFPSDTELLFNSLQLDLFSCDAAGLSMKAPIKEGTEHGVFVQGNNQTDHRNYDVAKFLHKQSEVSLRKNGAVDNTDNVDIDTGCIWLSSKIIKELYGLISKNGIYSQELFETFVNPKVCLNFYADFVYPLASEGSIEDFYKENPENGFSEELKNCRTLIWEKLHKYSLSLVKLVPAKYIHFGMTHEMYDLFVNDIKKYKYLGWEKRLETNSVSGTVINSYISSDSIQNEQSYIEDSYIENCTIGCNDIISNVIIHNAIIPDSIVLSGLILNNGKYVCRIYGKNDNPKASANADFLTESISTLIDKTNVVPQDIWGNDSASIWNARIYPECDSMEAAVKEALSLYRIIKGNASETEIEAWRKAKRYSLKTSFYESDVAKMLERQSILNNDIKTQLFIEAVCRGDDTKELIGKISFSNDLIEYCIEKINNTIERYAFPQNMRLALACADLCKTHKIENGQNNYTKYEDFAYAIIRETISLAINEKITLDWKKNKIVSDEVFVELPVRVNFCGSPSDAAPYCLEHGGTMIDGALLLKGKKPIRVIVKKIKEKGIRLGSIDQGYSELFTNIDDLRSCSNPFDHFALHKAVLVATGIIPLTIDCTMNDVINQYGSGFELNTSADVPKGSGLGTSSIIAAAAVKGVNDFFGIKQSDEMIYSQVFLVEQLMTTGGGWQDQVGGLTEGIKFFTAMPGAYQKIEVENLELKQEIKDELNNRFALIFSGQRRLARNVLREEMNQCIRNDSRALAAVKEIQEYCAIMRLHLLKGDITSFAKYITKQFELVKTLDKGASNTCIEYIFSVCDDLIDGKSICGAGGGGFLQVILKKGITKEMLRQRIIETFSDCGVELWDCELI